MKLLLLSHLAATLSMLGVILVVQIVHYPLFARVGETAFAAYQAGHVRLISFVVFPLMLTELGTALALAWLRPFGLPAWQVWTGLALLAVIWISTALLQVPLHQTLRAGFDLPAHRRLVATNWIRTLAWAARAVLVLAMVAPLMQESR